MSVVFIFLSVCAGFSPEASFIRVPAAPRASVLVATALPVADTEAAERLWASAGKPLLRIGKSGAAKSHANGLKELCSAHAYVCVRLTGKGTSGALDQLIELIDERTASGGDAESLTLLATRKPRKGGVEALFADSSRAEMLCSSDHHDALAKAAMRAEQQEIEDAVTYMDEREAAAARKARKSDKLLSKTGAPRQFRAANSQSRRTGVSMMAKYKNVEELKVALREYIDNLPEGAVDDASLPSPLNYKELSFNGRGDLVEECMAFGGYLKLSNELGLPVRIGVERPASTEKSGVAKVASVQSKKAFNLFNMFGKAG